MPQSFDMRRFASILLLLSLLLPLARPALAQGWEAGYANGRMIGIDPYIKVTRGGPIHSFEGAYIFTPRATADGYDAVYGHPRFRFGLQVVDLSRIRLKDPDFRPLAAPSRLGTSVLLFAAFERPLLRTPQGWSLDYTLAQGVSLNTHKWHRTRNPENEMLGSRFAIYFGAGLHVAYRRGGWEFRAGPDFLHLSNSALHRPNKGANAWLFQTSVRHYFDSASPDSLTRLQIPFTDRGFLVDVDYRLGLKTSVGEWLYDHNAERYGNPIRYGSYGLYASHGLGLGLLYRYSLKYASGLGLDLTYEPYAGRIEVQNPARPHDIGKTTIGLSLRHEARYRRLAATFALGVYLLRPLKRYALTDEEYGYYERIGLRYDFPCGLHTGFNIHAHRTKAYAGEWYVGFRFAPRKRKPIAPYRP